MPLKKCTVRSHGTELTQDALTDGKYVYDLKGDPLGIEFHDIEQASFKFFVRALMAIGVAGLLVWGLK